MLQYTVESWPTMGCLGNQLLPFPTAMAFPPFHTCLTPLFTIIHLAHPTPSSNPTPDAVACVGVAADGEVLACYGLLRPPNPAFSHYQTLPTIPHSPHPPHLPQHTNLRLSLALVLKYTVKSWPAMGCSGTVTTIQWCLSCTASSGVRALIGCT